jgi:hypothetical protein
VVAGAEILAVEAELAVYWLEPLHLMLARRTQLLLVRAVQDQLHCLRGVHLEQIHLFLLSLFQ